MHKNALLFMLFKHKKNPLSHGILEAVTSRYATVNDISLLELITELEYPINLKDTSDAAIIFALLGERINAPEQKAPTDSKEVLNAKKSPQTDPSKLLLTAGCSQKTIDDLVATKLIKDYQTLYQNLMKMVAKTRRKLSVTDLLFLSGEQRATKHAYCQTKKSESHDSLRYCASSGSLGAVNAIITDCNVNPNTTFSDGSNFLHHACLSGNLSAVEYLITKISSTKRTDTIGCNALHYAAQSGSFKMMRYCYEEIGIRPKSANHHGMNALHYAARSGNIQAIAYANNELHIPADAKDQYGRTAMHYAARHGHIIAIYYCYYELDLSPIEPDNDGCKPLDYAKSLGDADTIALITTLQTNHLNTIATTAIVPKITSFLDAKSTSIFLRSSKSLYQQPIVSTVWKDKLLAAGCRESELDAILEEHRNIELRKIYRHILTLSNQSIKKLTKEDLMYVSGDAKKIAHAYHKKNQQALCEDNIDNALLFFARCGDPNAMKHAHQDLRIPANTKDNQGLTALHHAAKSGSVPAVTYAIKMLDLSPYEKDNEGVNAITHAAQSGSTKVFEFLMQQHTNRLENLSEQHYSTLFSFLDTQSLIRLSACSKKLSQETSRASVWKNRFYSAGCQRSEIDLLFSDKNSKSFIATPKKFFKTLALQHRGFNYTLKKSDLLCLSGGVNDITAATHSESKSSCNPSQIHLIAWSGNIDGLSYAVKNLGFSINVFDPMRRNTVHYAAWSGSVECLQFVYEILNKTIPNCAELVSKSGENALHFAAFSGSIPSIKYAIHTMKINPASKTMFGLNAMHYAINGGSTDAVIFLNQLGNTLQIPLNPHTKDRSGRDAFWYATNNTLPNRVAMLKTVKELKSTSPLFSR